MKEGGGAAVRKKKTAIFAKKKKKIAHNTTHIHSLVLCSRFERKES
jgi:hypothetical protein